MHFFNPVPLMALVEVVAGPMTDPAVTDTIALLRAPARQDPGRGGRHAGLHRQPRGAPFYLEAFRILGEGAGRHRGGRRRDARDRLPDGPVRADRRDRRRREPRGEPSASSSSFFGDPRYRPASTPAARSSRPDGSAARRTAAATTTAPMAPAARRGPASLGARRTSAGPRSTRRRSRRASWRPSSTRRPRRSPTGSPRPDAIDTAMRLGTNWPEGPLGWGERIGLAVGGPHARRVPRRRGGWTLSRDAPAPHAGRVERLLLRRAGLARAAQRTVSRPSSSTWTGCCSIPRTLWHAAEASSSGGTAPTSRATTSSRVIGTSPEVTRALLRRAAGMAARARRRAGRRDGRASCTSTCDAQVDARPGAVELVEGSGAGGVPLGPRLELAALPGRRRARHRRTDRRVRRRSSPPTTSHTPSRRPTSTCARASSWASRRPMRWRSRTRPRASPRPRRPA